MAREGAVGLVDAQHPSAGTRVAFGDSATITVAVPLKPVPPKPDSVTPKSNDVAGLPDSVTAKTPGERPKPKRDTVVSPTVKKSGGIARVRVPPLVGLSRTNAIASLGRSRLLPGVITWATDSGATAKVVRQDPPADTMVRQGAPVDMTLAVPPPPPVVVPLVIGLAPDSAESLLALAALRAERRDTSVGFEPGGLVERQDPRARDTVPRGSVVQVLVGRRAIPWMLIVSCVLGVGGVGAFAWKLARDRGRIQEREAPLPVLGLDPKVGDGKHEMGSDQQRATGHELQLAAGTGAATQRVDGDETFIRERP
jgi:beta-lactam-binding protein with PASTA domain